MDAELADCAASTDWSRNELALTQTALEDADAVIAYGDDHTISALRQLATPQARFIGYGHKLSFGVGGEGSDDRGESASSGAGGGV